MPETPQDQLAREIHGIRLKDEQDLLLFLPLAARLAALGDDTQLRRWPTLAKEVKAALIPLLTDRCHEGIWDLHHAIGEDLGLSVIAAQDFACFRLLQHEIIPEDVKPTLEAWAEEAEDTSLDEEAVETLELFLHRFPLPEDLQLRVVNAPMSTFAEAVLAREASPRATIEAEWPIPVLDEVGELLMLDGGLPSDKLKRRIGREVEIEMENLGSLRISRRLGDDWQYVVDIEGLADKTEIESVRMGVLPAHPADRNRMDRWSLDLSHIDIRRRLEVLNAPIVVNTRNGPRLRVK